MCYAPNARRIHSKLKHTHNVRSTHTLRLNATVKHSWRIHFNLKAQSKYIQPTALAHHFHSVPLLSPTFAPLPPCPYPCTSVRYGTYVRCVYGYVFIMLFSNHLHTYSYATIHTSKQTFIHTHNTLI